MMVTRILQQNVGGYTGTIDTMLRESRPDTSYRSSTSIDVDRVDSASKQIQGLLYFSDIFGTGPGQIPLGAVITSATLTLSVADGTANSVTLSRMVQDWVGMPSQTWNAFGGGIQTDGTEALATPDATLAGLATGTRSIDVAQSLTAWSGGAANRGWLLNSGGSDGFNFSSSEGSAAPILTVTYDLPSIPVPGLSLIETGGATIVTEGGANDSFSIALKAAPTSDVTIDVSTSGPGDIAIGPVLVRFTPLNWQTPQIVALGAIDDTGIEGAESFTVTLKATSADGAYNGLSGSVPVTVIDNDAATPPLSPAVVAVHDTTQYRAGDPANSGSGDPSGIAYVPGLDLLFIADSEHDESPYFSTVNLFATRLDGTFVASYSLLGFTKEPTGLAYNPLNGLLYITDDDKDRIFIVDPTNPTVKISEINLKPYGITDAEDPVIDPATGHIFMLDGFSRSFIELTAVGGLVRSTVLPTAITDAEALAFDPGADVFYIASGATRGKIFQTDHDGQILASFDLLNAFTHPTTGAKPKIKGLEFAPSSDPHDGNRMSLYAVDYGVDQKSDGRMFEIDLHHGWLLA